ncbi:transposase [Brevibacterium aurantiacum]|nr:transposase [Brevibacterium aurantiacum]
MTTHDRYQAFTDQQWEKTEPLLPSNTRTRTRPFEDNRRIVEAIVYR